MEMQEKRLKRQLQLSVQWISIIMQEIEEKQNCDNGLIIFVRYKMKELSSSSIFNLVREECQKKLRKTILREKITSIFFPGKRLYRWLTPDGGGDPRGV